MNQIRIWAKNTCTPRSVINWLLGMILCPLGVAFAAKSGFGVSMIEAPVYVLHLKLAEALPWFTFGTSEYFVQGVLLIALWIAVRQFRPRYLLSFVTVFLYGLVLDRWNEVLSYTPTAMPLRLVYAALGILITALAVAFFFRTRMPQEVWELFVKELSDEYRFDTTKTKWIYDISSLCAGILLMLLFFRAVRWDAIGAGTIVTTLINAPIIGLFGKLIDRFEPEGK